MNNATFANGVGGAGGSSGAPGSSSNTAPPGGSGACSGSCPSLPIILPAVALLSGHQITAVLRCHASCHGTAAVHLLPASSSKPAGALLSQLTFTLHGSAVSTVHMTLARSALATLAAKQSLTVQLTVIVTVGQGHPTTFVSALELSRTIPAPQHKAASAQVSAAHHN
jgi:hypothetical protein